VRFNGGRASGIEERFNREEKISETKGKIRKE